MTVLLPHRISTPVGSSDSRPRRERLLRLAPPAWLDVPLACILLLQLGAMLTLQNSPFQDEALYLHVGDRMLDAVFGGATTMEAFSTYLSGLPYLYPVVAGLLHDLGGLELVRLLSTASILFATFAAYRVGAVLFGTRAGRLAAAAAACQTSFLFVGRLATYDALALALVAAAAVVAVETTRHVGRRTWLVAGLCVLAVLAKYAVAAIVPAVIVLLLLAPGIARGGRTVLRIVVNGMAAAGVTALGLWALLATDPALLTGLTRTTTDRDVSRSSSAVDLLMTILISAGAMILLAVVGWVALARWGVRRRTFALASALFGVALLVPAYHLLQGELISLDKHLAFSGFLLAPLAGLALHGMTAGIRTSAAWIAAAAILIVMFTAGVTGAQRLFAGWPGTTELRTVLLQLVRQDDTRVLAEEVEVPKYYLVGDHADSWQFTGLDFFEYGDASGDLLTGRAGYVEAIRDGYFCVIAFRYGPSAELAADLADEIERSGRYELVAELPYSTTSGTADYDVWRLIDAAGEEVK